MSGRYFYTHWLSDANVSKTNLLQARPGQDFTYQALSGSDTYAFTLINTFLVSYDRNAGNTGTGAPFGVDSLGSAVPARHGLKGFALTTSEIPVWKKIHRWSRELSCQKLPWSRSRKSPGLKFFGAGVVIGLE